MDNSQNILRMASAAAIFLVGVSVAYHYIIYIPSKDEAARNYLLAKQSLAEAEAEKKARREEAVDKAKALAAQQRRTSYQVCMSNAQADYIARWNTSCGRIATQNDNDRRNCLARGTAESTCLEWYPVRPTATCSLPKETANDYDKTVSEDKERCFEASSIEAAGIE